MIFIDFFQKPVLGSPVLLSVLVCCQTIGKFTKKALDGSVETTYPPLVQSTTEYTVDNVREARGPTTAYSMHHLRQPENR